MRAYLCAAAALAAVFPLASQAATLNGDVIDLSVTHGIETSYTALGGCQFYAATGAIGAGVEVGAANDVGGGCSGGIAVDIDGDGLMTLTPADTGAGDYRWAEILISGFDQVIAGVSLVSNDLFTLSGTGSVIPDPIISFTDSTIRILFDPAGAGIFDVTPATGGTTRFQIALRDGPAPIPLPASLPLLLAGLGGIGLMRRARRT